MKGPSPSELRRMRREHDAREPERARHQLKRLDRTISRIDERLAAAPGPLRTPEELGLRVVGQTEWWIHKPQGADNAVGGVEGKLTAIDVCGVRAFVRESVDRAKPTFMLSSGERLRQKQEGQIAGIDVLEVAAPRQALSCVVDAVRQADGLRRPVRTHPQFTTAWAEGHFRANGKHLPGGSPVQRELFRR